MANLSWRFPILDGGSEQGINNSGIATFKGSSLYSNLAREICQNSLDAKAAGKDKVIVEFNSLTLKKDEYAPLRELNRVFDSCKEYWKNRSESKLDAFFKEAFKTLAADTIDFLVIRDFNTTGLGGAKADMSEKSVWRALTHSNGVTDKANGSGGSYGIGKNAPIACSTLRTVFYNSFAEADNIRAFQGVAHLVTHSVNGVSTQGTGFYQNTDEKIPVFAEDCCEFRDIFSRDEYGTDVIVAGFKKTENWSEDIEKAVIKNFFVAINDDKLIVRIDDKEIRRSNLKDRIQYYVNKEKLAKETEFSVIMEFYTAITDPDNIEYGSILEKDDVVLYVKKDDSYSKSVAEMRSIGMVIRIRGKNIYSRYAAVMIVKEGKLNNLLKGIEPPEHNKWDPGILDDDPKAEKEARTIRGKLISWANETIVNVCKTEVPDEIDLDGVSPFLPFDEDDKSLGTEPEEDVSPDADSKPGEPSKKRNVACKVTIVAKKTKGVKDENSDPHNESHGGKGKGHGGKEDPEGKEDVTVPAQQSSGRSLNTPKVLQQRIVKMPAASTYRVALILENDCPTVNIALKSIGDDGRKDSVKIINSRVGKSKKVSVNSDSVSIKSLKANTLYEIFLELEYAEKMLLDLLVY